MEGNRNITKKEMLLAIAMSQYHGKTHVHFIPPKTNFVGMLKTLRSQKYLEPLGLSNYRLTVKGRNYLIKCDSDIHLKADSEVDRFIEQLGNNNCFGG